MAVLSPAMAVPMAVPAETPAPRNIQTTISVLVLLREQEVERSC